ncbi:FeoA family protein [Candidatus Arthromitus sp. SFB-rat-Yit]|uniref:FeoA family protein n=1 Tax=Candidatus Arthromitus sp. SFB-rat-Yit TaxID=1041504 RepID=UPI000227A56B|nr:FeoA domain-containing protein [Candidatus Arthromitus sp. SFB-rat-Yit]BAK81607.1 ferrous iron uptake protein feoa [Candidatus Arthromitus sp. SFB-rat-Yit]
MKNFNKISINESYKVEDIICTTSIKKRLNSLGILKNSSISIYKKIPLGGPIIINVNGCNIALEKKIFDTLILNKATGE